MAEQVETQPSTPVQLSVKPSPLVQAAHEPETTAKSLEIEQPESGDEEEPVKEVSNKAEVKEVPPPQSNVAVTAVSLASHILP